DRADRAHHARTGQTGTETANHGGARLMQVRADKLAQTLARTALPAWLVAGDEPFQIGECCDQIRKHAQANDFADRQLFSADTGIDWHAILNAAQSMGLFGGKTLIEIRLGEKRPDK